MSCSQQDRRSDDLHSRKQIFSRAPSVIPAGTWQTQQVSKQLWLHIRLTTTTSFYSVINNELLQTMPTMTANVIVIQCYNGVIKKQEYKDMERWKFMSCNINEIYRPVKSLSR
jgi:hypothetical protein